MSVCDCAPLAEEAAVRVYQGNDKVSFQKGLDTCSWTVGRNSLSSAAHAPAARGRAWEVRRVGFARCGSGRARRWRGGKLLGQGARASGAQDVGGALGVQAAQTVAGRGAHPGGAAPGGDLGAAVAQPPLLGHRLMTALQPRAPARRSCLAGGLGRVEGLPGRAEGAESWPRMRERTGSGSRL